MPERYGQVVVATDITIPIGNHVTDHKGWPEWAGVVLATVVALILLVTVLLLTYRARRARRDRDKTLVG